MSDEMSATSTSDATATPKRAFDPNARYLSTSSISTYEQCPRRYYFDRLTRTPHAPSRSLILGNAVHAIFERDGIARKLDPDTGEIAGNGFLLEQLEVGFRDALRDEAERADPYHCLDLDDLSFIMARGLAIVREYYRLVAPTYRPVATEERFEMPLAGVTLPDNGGTIDYRFSGRRDARTLPRSVRDGRLVSTTIDFKTAEKPWYPGREHESEQATAYAWGDLVDGRPISEQFTFLVFTSSADAGVERAFRLTHDDALITASLDVRVTRRSEGDVERYHAYAYSVAERIERDRERGHFVAKPSPLCGYCDCLASCPVGQQWLRQRGRTPRPEIATFIERVASDVDATPMQRSES